MRARSILRSWCIAVALIPSSLIAAPATLTGTGVWTAVEPNDVVNISGLGTDTITWGTPLSGNQSGYKFTGNTVVVDPLDGTVFRVGTFTHNNFVLSPVPTPNSITGATLKVEFDITGSSVISRSFTFHFLHAETPNLDNPCPLPTPHAPPGSGCEDVVSLESVFSQETFEFEGSTVKLEILGFQNGGVLVDQFLTLEGASNTAFIEARFTSDFPGASVPEPSSAVLLLGGLWGLALSTRRQRSMR